MSMAQKEPLAVVFANQQVSVLLSGCKSNAALKLLLTKKDTKLKKNKNKNNKKKIK